MTTTSATHSPLRHLPAIVMLLGLATSFTARGAEPRVTRYPFPAGIPESTQFRVTVDGQAQFVHAAEVADFAMFAIGGPVEVAVTCSQPVKAAVVRPRSRNIAPKIDGQTVRFTVDAPGPLCLEINGIIRPALFLFVDPPEADAPAQDAPGVVRFAGGKVHEAGEIRLRDGQTLYLEPGAVVRGTVRAEQAKNVRVAGRGILDARERTQKTTFVQFKDCTGVEVRDVVVLGSYGWTLVPWHCTGVRLSNVKVYSWRDNDDGLDVCSCRDVLVDRCFFRTKDDCIALKALRTEYFPAGKPPTGSDVAPEANPPPPGGRSGAGDIVHVRVERSVFWNAEWGNALEIGFELRTPGVRDVVWRDCDIVREQRGAVFSIHNGDFAAVENVLFENIRVEDAQNNLIDFHVGLSVYSGDCPERYHRRNPKRKPTGAGPWVPFALLSEAERAEAAKNRGAIRNVRFKDIRLMEGKVPPSLIINDGGQIDAVTFENIRLGDRVLERMDDLKLKVDGATGVECRHTQRTAD